MCVRHHRRRCAQNLNRAPLCIGMWLWWCPRVATHTQVKAPNLHALATRHKVVYDPPRYMTVAECADQLLHVAEVLRAAGGDGPFRRSTPRCGGEPN